MHPIAYFPLLTVVQCVSGALLGGGRARRMLGVLVAFVALAIPWLMPNDPLMRAILALGIAMTFLRSIDLARENKPRALWFRILHVAIPIDTRRIHRAAPDVRIRLLAKTFLYLAIAFAAWHVAASAGPLLSNPLRDLERWGAGLLFVYAFSDVAYGGAEFLFRALGFDLYELHRAPAASLSVKEFWGDRWNRTVSSWLRDHILKPLTRRTNVKVGMLGSFFVSATLHAYLVLVAMGFKLALVMLGYFLLQGVFVLLEIALNAKRWSPAVARAWTLTLMIASSPLFVEPALQIFGI